MEIRALILINSKNPSGDERIAVAGPPLAVLDVAGKSPLQRVVDHLKQYGVIRVTAVLETTPIFRPRRDSLPCRIDCRTAAPGRFWPTCDRVFQDMARSADLVLLIGLGAYAEIDVDHLVQFHLAQSCQVTQVIHDTYAPEIFCFSASRGHDAASLFRAGLSQWRSCACFLHSGYVNPLADARDLRQFAIDMLMLKTHTRPAGVEARPGVWVAPGAVLEKGSRILAPAFVGASARIRAGAVITRCSTIEYRAHVDCGTVVENSTVLPGAYVGAGLDVAHSVVGLSQVVNLRQDATVEVLDQKLVGQTPTSVELSRKLFAPAASAWSWVISAIERWRREAREAKMAPSRSRTSTQDATSALEGKGNQQSAVGTQQ